MKKFLLFLWISSVVTGAYAQKEDFTDNKTDKEFNRQQKIEKRKADKESDAKMVDTMIYNRKFILRPLFVTHVNNTIYNLSSQSSYIAVDSNYITVELEAITEYYTYRGIAGINNDPWYGGELISGTISVFEEEMLEKSDKGYSIHLSVYTILGRRFNIFLHVTPNGNANAFINELDLRYTGSLTRLENNFIRKQNSFY